MMIVDIGEYDKALKSAAQVLRAGELIVYPTDTLYGIRGKCH